MRYLRMIQTRGGNVRVVGDEGIRRLFPSVRVVNHKSRISEEEAPGSKPPKVPELEPEIRTHD